MPSVFLVPKPSQIWCGPVEDRGKGASFEPAHFCSQYVQPLGLACIQTMHMCVHAQSKGLCALGETPFALRHLPEESDETTALQNWA